MSFCTKLALSESNHSHEIVLHPIALYITDHSQRHQTASHIKNIHVLSRSFFCILAWDLVLKNKSEVPNLSIISGICTAIQANKRLYSQDSYYDNILILTYKVLQNSTEHEHGNFFPKQMSAAKKISTTCARFLNRLEKKWLS